MVKPVDASKKVVVKKKFAATSKVGRSVKGGVTVVLYIGSSLGLDVLPNVASKKPGVTCADDSEESTVILSTSVISNCHLKKVAPVLTNSLGGEIGTRVDAGSSNGTEHLDPVLEISVKSKE